MKYYVMTLFPEMIEQAMNTSIMGRAMADGLISLQVMNIRDYTLNKHGKVDDYPYGGGAGMVSRFTVVMSRYAVKRGKDHVLFI